EPGDKVGIADRFEESGKLPVRLADKPKEFGELGEDYGHHQDGPEEHVRSAQHKDHNGNGQTQSDHPKQNTRPKVLESESHCLTKGRCVQHVITRASPAADTNSTLSVPILKPPG